MNSLNLNARQLFLIDSLGALLSAFFLGVVLARLEGIFGMPLRVLYPLAIIALVLCAYSAWCYWRQPAGWRPYLKAIALANLGYACLTLGLVAVFRYELELWGWAYFGIEISLVAMLGGVEWKTARKA